MEGERKTHSNSVLKNLSEEMQAEIIGRIEAGYSYVETGAWLEGKGVTVAPEMVSRFFHWFILQRTLNTCSEVSLEKAAECKRLGLIKTLKEERLLAQVFFNRMVREEKDPKMWAMVEKVNLAKDKVGLDERRLEMEAEILKEKSGKAKEGAVKPKLTAEERQRRIRQILGTE